MKQSGKIRLVTTIKERCRVCYTCVRECPAKAIRIAEGQAEVITERCIGCGNCLRVCSQHAKQVYNSIPAVEGLLAPPAGQKRLPVVACVAPSFPAEFADVDYRRVVGALRAMGFDRVCEVAFGADLVADRYQKLLAGKDCKRYVATSCPAIVTYVERYHPDLVEKLAPIVSPMVALARALRRIYGKDIRVVFIGPCIAKKGEVGSANLAGDVDEALTFIELRQMMRDRTLAPETARPSEFDPPHGASGALFAVSRGLLQAANIHEDLVTGEVVAADGRNNFVEAIREFEDGDLDARLLEVLCCSGCIMGAGASCDAPLFSRRRRVSQFVRDRLAGLDKVQWGKDMDSLADLDLSRSYTADDQRIVVPYQDEIADIMARMGKHKPEDELNCGACGYDTCREHAVAIFKGLAESEMCLPHTIEHLRSTVKELAVSNSKLADAQEALVQSEKLASMGQLAAGIAHEVNNPLGVVLMYSHLLLEEAPDDPRVKDDLQTIAREADRCKKIVAGLLDFARQSKVRLTQTDVRELVRQSLRVMPAPADVEVRVQHELADPRAEMDHDQVLQVVTNLISNACAAMPKGGTLTIRTAGDDAKIRIIVTDTGVGIPPENMKKIFEPFFTTKHIGKGTGLGLAVSYGIVKMHRGDIRCESNADPVAGPTGSVFTVTLPRHGRAE